MQHVFIVNSLANTCVCVCIHVCVYVCVVLGHRQHTEVAESITTAPSPDQMEAMRCAGIMRRRHVEMLKYFEEVGGSPVFIWMTAL